MTEIVPFLRYPSSGTTIEDVLEQLRAEADSDSVRKVQLMAARFYLQHAVQHRQSRWLEVAHDVSNYATLFEELRTIAPVGEPIAVVTYNYDTLAERGLERQQRSFASVSSYVYDARWLLFKVHGSINWARRTNLDPEIANLETANAWLVAREVIKRAGQIQEEGPVVDWTGGIPVSRDALGSLMPALAVPFRTKQTFEIPDEHLSKLRGLLPSVTQVLVVGWRGIDPALVDMLRDAKPRVTTVVAVARANPDETLTNLARAFTASHVKARTGGFSDYVLSRQVREDLA